MGLLALALQWANPSNRSDVPRTSVSDAPVDLHLRAFIFHIPQGSKANVPVLGLTKWMRRQARQVIGVYNSRLSSRTSSADQPCTFCPLFGHR